MSEERPILFNAEMVRAVLSGRKTQTRRVIKVQPPEGCRVGWFSTDDGHPHDFHFVDEDGDSMDSQLKCPYGKVGDQLWVRETFFKFHEGLLHNLDPDPDSYLWATAYRADDLFKPDHYGLKWKPSIFMPREDSRIQLEITNIRVERVQDITNEGAISEGIVETDWGMYTPKGQASLDGGKTYHPFKEKRYDDRFHSGSATGPDQCLKSAKSAFGNLWNSINEKRGYGWDKNPYVWVVDFKKM